MGSSPAGILGWGIDFGSAEDRDPKYDAFIQRLEDEEYDGDMSEWFEYRLEGLFIDVSKRDFELGSLRRDAKLKTATPEERKVYTDAHDSILKRYPVPVRGVFYGYEYDSYAVVLTRSYVKSEDWGMSSVDVKCVQGPTEEEFGHFSIVMQAAGLEFEKEDVQLLLMTKYA